MPVDFNALVLAPAMATFAKAVVIYPVSGDGVVGFPARGVFTSVPIDVQMQDGGIFSDQRTSLGMKADDLLFPLAMRDRIEVDGVMYWVGDIDNDGQGGLMIELRKTAPPEFPS